MRLTLSWTYTPLKKKKLYTCDASILPMMGCEDPEEFCDCSYVEQGDDTQNQTVATCYCDNCP